MSTSNPHHEGNPSLEFKVRPDLEDGTKEMKITPKDLSIVWGEDSRYWNVPKDEESPAELYQVSWLEVSSSVDKTNPYKEYEVGFNVTLTPDAFGWGSSTVYILVKRGKSGTFRGTKFYMDATPKDQSDIKVKMPKAEKPPQDSDDASKLYFGLYEVWSGKWKGGLKIHHAFIKEFT